MRYQNVTVVAARLNSYYDSCRSLLTNYPAKLEVEIAFIKENIKVFAHLAQGIDRLQGKLNPENYMGFLFHTLLRLQHIYEQLSQSRA